MSERAQGASARAAAVSSEWEAGKRKALRAAVAVLVGALARDRRRGLAWGFGRLDGFSAALESKVFARGGRAGGEGGEMTRGGVDLFL